MSGYWKLFKKELHEKLWRPAFWALVEFLNGGDLDHDDRETNAERVTREGREEKIRQACKCYNRCVCTKSEGDK